MTDDWRPPEPHHCPVTGKPMMAMGYKVLGQEYEPTPLVCPHCGETYIVPEECITSIPLETAIEWECTFENIEQWLASRR